MSCCMLVHITIAVARYQGQTLSRTECDRARSFIRVISVPCCDKDDEPFNMINTEIILVFRYPRGKCNVIKVVGEREFDSFKIQCQLNSSLLPF